MSAPTVLQRIQILTHANRTVGSVALQIDHPDMSATMARNALTQAAQARRVAAVVDTDPPALRQALADLLTNETTLIGCTGAKGWQ
jgi:hypothetical protein